MHKIVRCMRDCLGAIGGANKLMDRAGQIVEGGPDSCGVDASGLQYHSNLLI